MALGSRAAKPLSAYLSRHALGLLTLGGGVATLLALTPLPLGMLILAGGIAIAIALFEPLAALALALLFGPARALLAAAWPGAPIFPGQVLFGLFALAWLLHGLFRRRLRLRMPAFTVPALLYVGVGALSLWGAADPLSGLFELIKWLQLVAVALLVFDCCRRRPVGWVLTAALASGVLQATIGLWEFALRGSGPETFAIGPGLFRAYGTFEQPNPFGGYMGMIWPLAAGSFLGILSVSRREVEKASRTVLGLIVLAAAALALGGLVVSYSRGAWFAAIAAAGMMAVFGPHKRVWGIVVALVGFGAVFGMARGGALPVDIAERFASVAEFTRAQDARGATIDPANFSLIERTALWEAAIRMASARPWLGVGLGNFQAAYPDFRLLNWEHALGHAHNVYLNVVAETGMLGLGAYLLLWGSVFLVTLRAIRGNSSWRRWVALGLLGVWTHLAVHNLVDYLFVNNVHLFLGALFGVLAVIDARTGTENEFSLKLHVLQASE